MHKIIILGILTSIANVYNVHAMLLVDNQQDPAMQKVMQFHTAMLNEPWHSFELIQACVEEHRDEIEQVDPSTGNTLLHEDVIECCWGKKTGRLLRIAALLAHGADRHKKNIEGFSPVECAQIAGNQAAIDLLNVEKPTKETLIELVKKHKLVTLRPLLFEP